MRGQLIEKSKGVWLIRIQKRTADGKRISESEVCRGSKTEAQKRLTRKLAELDTGHLIHGGKQRLDEYLDMWLEHIARPRLHARTYEDYATLLRLHVRPTLGNLRLSDIKPAHVQSLYGQLQSGSQLSARRVRYVHAVLSSALRKAVELDIVTRNVAKLAQLPKLTKKEMSVLDEAQCSLFLAACQRERLRCLFEIALGTGMRPEEYLALQWKDLDFDRKNLSVRRVLIRLPRRPWYFAEPKTKLSSRTISLPAGLLESLRLHRLAQMKERLKLGPAWSDHDLVFPSEVGTPLTHSNVTQVHKRILTYAGLPSTIRLYDLRHTHATLLLKADVHPKIVSERLGHSTISLTLDVYSHVLPSMQAKAADMIDGLLYRRQASK